MEASKIMPEKFQDLICKMGLILTQRAQSFF